MKQDKRILYFIIYWIIYSGLIAIYLFRNELLNFVADLGVVVLLLRGKSFKFSNIKKCLGTYIPLFFYLFLLIGSFSALLNFVSFPSYVWVLHFYVRYWILLICIYNTFDYKDVIRTKRIYYNASIFNIVLCFIQVTMGVQGDSLGGTFALGNSEISLLIMIVTIMGSCDYFRGELEKKKAIFILIGFFFIAIVGEIKFLYFMIPLYIGAAYLFIKKLSVKLLIIFVFATYLFVPIMKYILSFYYDENYIEFVFNAEEVDEHLHKAHVGNSERGMNRATSIEIVSKYIFQDSQDLMIGNGIGSGSASSFFASDIYKKYNDTNYYNFTPAYLLVETGWLGSICYYMVYIAMFLLFYNKYRKTNDNEIKYWSSCGLLGSAMTGMFIWYNVLPIYTYYIFFVFFAICFTGIKERSIFFKRNNYNGEIINNSSMLWSRKIS